MNEASMKFTRLGFFLCLFLSAVAGGLFVFLRLEDPPTKDLATTDSKNYSLIVDNLYMGGLVQEPPPGTQAVLNLCEFPDPYQCEIHLPKPIRDAAPAPSLAWLRQNVEFVDQQLRAGKVTYVHCFGGASRSGMVVIAYIMSNKHWTRDQALEFVRSKRPETRPNDAFMQLLLEWEREVLMGSVAG
jgi:Dual specificity phosphatase, catalytic domain